jgi:hypothetical protein
MEILKDLKKGVGLKTYFSLRLASGGPVVAGTGG